MDTPEPSKRCEHGRLRDECPVCTSEPPEPEIFDPYLRVGPTRDAVEAVDFPDELVGVPLN